jgi:hypothetical protein
MTGTAQTNQRTSALDQLHDPKCVSKFIERLEATDRTGRLHLSEALFGRIRGAIWCASEHSGKDPSNMAAERLLSKIGAQIESLVPMMEKLVELVGQQLPYPTFKMGCLPGCDDAIALMEILRRTGSAIAEREAYPRVRRAMGVNDRPGRPPDRAILWLVSELARIYREAGGRVTAGLKGSFAKFLEIVFEILPRHLQWSDRAWFAGYAKKVPVRLRSAKKSVRGD